MYGSAKIKNGIPPQYQQKPRRGNLIANLSKSIAFFTLSAVGDFYQFEQLEALLSSYPLWRHIMAVLAILGWTIWTLLVTTQLQMN